MIKKFFFFLIAMGSFSFATAGSIRLINDSIYPLKVIVYADDGSTAGELILQPTETKYWSDLWGEQGKIEFGDQGDYQNYRYSRTPYRIVWFCLSGSEFSLCNDIPTASTVRARDCYGGQVCKPEVEPIVPP